MNLKCSNCGHEFDGYIFEEGYGLVWRGFCPKCSRLFDVEIPKGRIVMAFAWDEDDEYFTDDWRKGNGVYTYYAFDTPEEFMKAWKEMRDDPDGMWYWVLDNGKLICSGACDYMDEDVYIEQWNLEGEKE